MLRLALLPMFFSLLIVSMAIISLLSINNKYINHIFGWTSGAFLHIFGWTFGVFLHIFGWTFEKKGVREQGGSPPKKAPH